MDKRPPLTRFERVVARLHRHQVRFFFAVVALTILHTAGEWW